MLNSKLIEMLRTFNSKEMKKFESFLLSPYFNKKSNALKLLKNILRYSPEFISEKLNKKNIYEKMFPGRSYNDKVMRNLMSELVRSGKKFLELENYEHREYDRYNYSLNEYLKRKLFNFFDDDYKKAGQILKTAKKDEDYFYYNLILDSLKHSFELRTRAGLEKLEEKERINENLVNFFLIWYFKHNYNLIRRKVDYNFKPDLNFIEKVIDYIKQRRFENNEIILIYYNMFMSALKPNEEEYFRELRVLSNKDCGSLNKQEQYNIYSAMMSYCLRKVTGGSSSYKDILFEICGEMLLNGTYTYRDDGVILPLVYKNIVKAGTWVKRFEWVVKFIEEYRKKLLPEYQFNVYNYCLSFICFTRGDFEESLHHLSVVKYENVYDKAEVNRLAMQIYYEMNLTEELLSLIDTYKHFLRNDRLISEERKKLIMTFVKFLGELLKIKMMGKGNNLFKFKMELMNSELYEKNWLLEKVEQLSK